MGTRYKLKYRVEQNPIKKINYAHHKLSPECQSLVSFDRICQVKQGSKLYVEPDEFSSIELYELYTILLQGRVGVLLFLFNINCDA